MALQEAHDEEACLEEQVLSLMHRFADRFTNRMPEINRLMTLPDHPLIEYGHYALGCMTGADMKKATYLKIVRDEFLKSMEEKRQLIKNYKEICIETIQVLKSKETWLISWNSLPTPEDAYSDYKSSRYQWQL
ncbi:hypothetical protein Tco_0809049 [Tanacetum coccineum]